MFNLFKNSARSSAAAGPIQYILVGLGNPGREYENTRHNIGFIALDMLAEQYNVKINRIKFKSLTGECVIDGKKVLLLKPQTYMNNSGEAVRDAMQFYKVEPQNVIIMFDDISLEPGNLRIRQKGSDGGHNGIKSIIYLTGSDKFPRIKIGVGAKPHPNYDLAKWVLSSFKSDEIPRLKQACKYAGEAAELIVKGNIAAAMNQFNAKNY